MPKDQSVAISRTQVLAPTSHPEATQVLAHPVDQLVTPRTDTALSQLVSGLATVNPKLEAYFKQEHTNDAHANVAAGEDWARRKSLAMLDPAEALKQPTAMPSTVDPAYAGNFERGYRNVLGTAMADKVQSDMLTDWGPVKHTANADAWLKEWVGKNASGFTDPLVLAKVSTQIEAGAKAIRTEARARDVKALDDKTRDNINAGLSAITSAQEAPEQFATYRQWVDTASATGLLTKAELNMQALDRMNAVSESLNGAPEQFNMFFGGPRGADGKPTLVDPATGKTLAELNPDLAVKALKYQKEAQDKVDKRIAEASQGSQFTGQMAVEAEIQKTGTLPSVDYVKNLIGKNNFLKDANEAASWWHAQVKVVDKLNEGKGAIEMMGGGFGYMLKPEDQKKALATLTTPLVVAAVEGINAGTPEGTTIANGAVARLLGAIQKTGASVQSPPLEQMAASILNSFPKPEDGPTPTFKFMANLYRQMPPNLRSAYFPGDLEHLFSNYNANTTQGSTTNLDDKSAYQQAFSVISPEAKQHAEKLRTSPEFNSMIAGKVKNLTTSVWRDVFGFQVFGTYPTNEADVALFAQREATRFATQNPMASTKVITEHTTAWYASRFVHDTTANQIVEVPAGTANETMAKAVSAYTERAKKEYGPESNPSLLLVGTTYQLRNGATGKIFQTGVRPEDILHHQYLKENWDVSTKEGERMATFSKSLADGTVTAAAIAEAGPLIAKARLIDAWSPEKEQQLVKARSGLFMKDMQNIVPMSAGKPTNENIGYANAWSTDRTMTDTAKRYWQAGHFGKALTTMGEGNMLRVYNDPARGAGKNISIGYNLDANAGTLVDDFRRAGIDPANIPAIKEGRASITEEQSTRLFDVAYTRYEAIGKQTVDSLYGRGSWEKIGDNKRAVITDVAYQVGAKNLQEFKPSFEALINGDKGAQAGSFKVHYTPRSGGPMIPDVGRNNLRSHLLNGTGTFAALIDEVAARPRGLIEAHAQQQQASTK